MNPVCVVFADAFSCDSYKRLSQKLTYPNFYRLTPGMGYSSNLHYQIFEGKSPDDVDFFSDFAYDGKFENTTCNKIGTFLDETRPLNDLFRYFYRRITKTHDNIPFCERNAFIHKGTYKFMKNEDCYVFGRKCAKAYEKSVRESFSKAWEYLNNNEKNIIVVLEELDRQGHVVGSTGKTYVDAAELIVAESQKLFSHFKNKYPDGNVVLISDHGMSPVYAGVNVIDLIYREIGKPGKDFFFFCDSIYLRFWTKSIEKTEKIKTVMDKLTVLDLVDCQTREKFGTKNTEFGDLIYRIKEGYTFDPNCFGITGHSICAGLHGYMEHTDSASGIIVTDIDLSCDDDIGANEIFSRIVKAGGDYV